jgi:hypothetical protein
MKALEARLEETSDSVGKRKTTNSTINQLSAQADVNWFAPLHQ